MSSEKCLKKGYLGFEASGKTAAALYDSKGEKLIIRVDINHQDSLAKNASVIYEPAELARVIRTRDKRRKLAICYRGAELSGVTPLEAFTLCCRVAIAAPERCALLADEADSLIPKSGALPEPIDAVLRRGLQHLLVPVYWTSLRPASINLDLRNGTQEFKYFGGDEPTYTDFIKRHVGPDAVDHVKKLGKYSYILKKTGQKWQEMPPLSI